MRGTLAGLPSPHPLARSLPAVYQDEDPFTVRLTQAFDELLAPIIATLDNLPAYIDPALAPEDFVDWLAEWVGIELDETWDLERRRRLVATATDLHGRRGTAAGLADHVRLATGGEVEVVENGGTAWSVDSGSPLPGTSRPALLVRVRVGEPASVDTGRLDRLVTSVKPAHVPHRIEVQGRAPAGGGKRRAEAAPAPEAADGDPSDGSSDPADGTS
jgi:phage tail-like protein